MDLYVPDGVAASPAIVVSLHYCGGTAANAHSWFQSYADHDKFIIIAPKSAGSCFDAGLGRTGERANIVKMVQYVMTMNNADPKKVFAAGPSSGACMTHALLASYPDVFAGGSSLAGVPAGAWTGGGAYGWSAPASTTAQQWGDKVRNADPGFTGARPRIQFWQGMGDTNLTYSQTYPAQVAQWTNVFGVTDANATKESIKPPGAANTWARTSYKDCSGLVVVEANSGPSNVVHDLTPEGLWRTWFASSASLRAGTAVGGPCGGTGGAGGGAGGAGGAGRTAAARADAAAPRRRGRPRRPRRRGGRGRRSGAAAAARHGRRQRCRSGAGGSGAGTGGSNGTGSGGSIGTARRLHWHRHRRLQQRRRKRSSGTGSGGAIVTGSAGTGSSGGNWRERQHGGDRRPGGRQRPGHRRKRQWRLRDRAFRRTAATLGAHVNLGAGRSPLRGRGAASREALGLARRRRARARRER